MTTDLHLGDETRLRLPNPFVRLHLPEWQPMPDVPPEPPHVALDAYREVSLAAIIGESPLQVRAAFDPDRDPEDRALLDSLASDGQRVPVLLTTPDPNRPQRYRPLDGHRRIAALRVLGRPVVKAIIVAAGSRECDLISLTANVRKNLAPIELARALNRLETEHGLKPDEVARRVGLTRSYVWELRRLLKAPPAITEAVEGGRIAVKTALALMRAPEDQQPQLLALAESHGLSEATTRRLVEEVAKHGLAPEEAATKLNLAPTAHGHSTISSPGADGAPKPQASARPAGASQAVSQEEASRLIREWFSDLTEEQSAEIAELCADQPHPRKMLKAACLLVLSNWEPVRAVGGAEQSSHDPQVRRVLAMLDLCLELENLLRSGTQSPECAPMLVGLIRRLTITKRLALPLAKE